MRKVLCTLGLLVLGSIPAAAQSWRADVYGGYNYTRFDTGSASVGDVNLNGWNASLNLKPWRWFGIVSDFSGSYGSPFGPTTSFYTYLFGPQIALPTSVSPFVHVLVGERESTRTACPTTPSPPRLAVESIRRSCRTSPGGFFQVDYLATRFAGHTQNNTRVSTGIVIHASARNQKAGSEQRGLPLWPPFRFFSIENKRLNGVSAKT